jgi:hypothetical protein
MVPVKEIRGRVPELECDNFESQISLLLAPILGFTANSILGKI